MKEIDEDNIEYQKNLEEAKHFMRCSICYFYFDNAKHVPLGLQCGHTFCSECILKNLKSYECPLCKYDMGDQQNKNM